MYAPSLTMDSQTLELANARIRLRSDLRFTLHRRASVQWYVVEDDSRNQYFRIGRSEYAFLSLLDGTRTLEEAQSSLASLPGGFTLEEGQASQIAKWMIDAGLAQSYGSFEKSTVDTVYRKDRERQAYSFLNPISIRIPLFNPDSLLQSIHRSIRWMIGIPLAIVWLVVSIIGFGMLAMHWTKFRYEDLRAISAEDAFWFAVVWLLLKGAHEASHGLACKHYGGRVPQLGLQLFFFIPLPYVDVTSSWRFRDKSHRIATSAAGMMAEVFLAAIAAILWCRLEPGPLQYHARNILIAGTVNTIFFNINPLQRMDGYYILADWLDMPNLSSYARHAVKSGSKSLLFATRFRPSTESILTRRFFVYVYGWSALVWQILITVGMTFTAVNYFPGVGVALAAIALIFWLGFPLWKFLNYLHSGYSAENGSRRRLAWIAISGAAFVSVLSFAPAPPTIRAPMVLQQDLQPIRSQSAGRILEIHVRPGEQVPSGTLLFTLTNQELDCDHRRAEIELRAAHAEATKRLSEGDIELWQIAMEHCSGIERRLHELTLLVQGLEIRTPSAGQVLIENSSELLGQFVMAGEELCQLRCSDRCRAIALIDQSDAKWLNSERSPHVEVMIWGSGGSRIPSQILSVHPRASFDLPHAAFASTLGGPIAVLDRHQTNSAKDNRVDSMLTATTQWQASSALSMDGATRVQDSNQQQSSATRGSTSLNDILKGVRSVKPFVQVDVQLDDSIEQEPTLPQRGQGISVESYYDGQTGVLLATGRRSTLGEYFYSAAQNWIKERILVTHGL